MVEPSKKPLNILVRYRNSVIRIKLKNDYEYVGRMLTCDSYMNLILTDADEYKGNDPSAHYGNIFIRGNNVLYIQLRA
ncbi:MAG: LSM domain-containing protein [Candidatus Bathyarchaeia archaeon]